MRSFIVLVFLAGLAHFITHVSIIVAFLAAAVLWALWKVRYIVLAFLGLEMLLGE
jgi:hypothetical protein